MKKLLFISSFILLLFITTGCQNNTNTKTSNSSSETKNNTTTITTPDSNWKLMDDSNNTVYNTNYEATTTKSNEEYPQIITVYSNEMTEDRKTGELISSNEYIEAFPGIGPNTITVQIRIDKESSWIMSRQTFKSKNDYTGQFSIPYNTLINIENLQNDIDTTIYILNNDF